MGDEYRVVWAPFGPDSDVGRRAGADRPILLPYFLDGDGLELRRQGRGVALDDFDLLRGILVAYRDDPPGAEPGELRPYLGRALDELVGAFGRPSLEVMILETAVHLARAHGWTLGRKALETGVALRPRSARLRCDLAVALWRALESGEAIDPTETARLILAHAGAVTREDLPARPAQFLFLVERGARALLGQHDEADSLDDAKRPRHFDPDLAAKLDELRAAGEAFDPRAWSLLSEPPRS